MRPYHLTREPRGVCMSDHTNDITIGEVKDDKVAVKFYGPLSQYVQGLRRYVAQAHGVTDAIVVDGEAIIIATCKLMNERDTMEQVRIRIRNRCRDYIGDVTGYISNIGPEGSYADLIEEAQPALV